MYHYYIVQVYPYTNEEVFHGPYNSPEVRKSAIVDLVQKHNQNLLNSRVRSRFYRADIANSILHTVINDAEKAA